MGQNENYTAFFFALNEYSECKFKLNFDGGEAQKY